MKDGTYYYHYTNEEAFNSIKDSKIIWFSQIGCSNDNTDSRYASYSLFHKALDCAFNHDETKLTEKKYIGCIIDNLKNFDLYRNDHRAIFGVCLCEYDDNDVLNNKYGRYKIRFDINGIIDKLRLDNPGCPAYWLRFNKVVYTESEYFELVRKLLYKAIKDRMYYVDYLLEDINDPHQVLECERLAIVEASKGIYSSVFSESSILYKSIDWRGEQEYRLYIIEGTFDDWMFQYYSCIDSVKFTDYIKEMGLHSSLKKVNAENNKGYYEFNVEMFKRYIIL
jgi:hypothetical protein